MNSLNLLNNVSRYTVLLLLCFLSMARSRRQRLFSSFPAPRYFRYGHNISFVLLCLWHAHSVSLHDATSNWFAASALFLDSYIALPQCHFQTRFVIFRRWFCLHIMKLVFRSVRIYAWLNSYQDILWWSNPLFLCETNNCKGTAIFQFLHASF